jgi:copper chaperone CopZ
VQVALQEIPGVSSVQIDMISRKAVVQVEEKKVTDNQLVNAVDNAKGMHPYRATLIQAIPKSAD